MRFKEYLCEEKYPYPDFKIMLGDKHIHTLKELIMNEKPLMRTIQQLALDENWTSAEYNSLLNTKPDQDSMNGGGDRPAISNEFMARDTSAMLHFESMESEVWDWDIKCDELFLRVNSRIYLIENQNSKYSAKAINTNEIRVPLYKNCFNMNSFYNKCKKIGYTAASDLTDNGGSIIYGILYNWVVFS